MAKAAFFFATFLFLGVAAANNDDSFVWLDANTKIKVLKPVSAASGGSAQPKKDAQKEKKEKNRRP